MGGPVPRTRQFANDCRLTPSRRATSRLGIGNHGCSSDATILSIASKEVILSKRVSFAQLVAMQPTFLCSTQWCNAGIKPDTDHMHPKKRSWGVSLFSLKSIDNILRLHHTPN